MPLSGALRAQIGTLIVATSAIQLGNGFFGTFISLRVPIEHFGATLAGLVLSSYFAGFTLGALFCSRIIERVGHVRAYAAFAGLAVAATATMPLLLGPLSWMVLRGVIGFGCAGLFVATESWLNAKAQPDSRGRVFATYMVGTFVALAIGQLLIVRAEVEATSPFMIVVVLFAGALVMVSATRAEQPAATSAPMLPYGQLTRAAPIATFGSVLSGLIGGAFYALVPAWMQEVGIQRSTIALFMLAAVLGGLAFQIPIGSLSDRFDRRFVLVGLALGFACAAVALLLLPRSLSVVLPVAAILGGFMSTLYPVCVAHAHDCMPADRVVAVSSQLILVSGIGSVLGPLLGTGVMAQFDIYGLFYFMAAAAILLAVLAAAWSWSRPEPVHLERPFEILTPQAASLAHDALDHVG
jgi:MFS family permease